MAERIRGDVNDEYCRREAYDNRIYTILPDFLVLKNSILSTTNYQASKYDQ